MRKPKTIHPDRRTYLGSSDAAAVLGISPWRTPYQVWQAKTSPVPLVEEDKKVFTRGKRLEPVVLQMLGDDDEREKIAKMFGGGKLKIVERNARATDPEFPYLSSEIDAVAEIIVGKSRETINVEVKTVHPSKAYQWGEEFSDEIPLWYAVQILFAQGVTGRSRTLTAVLIGADDLRLYVVDRDEALIAGIRTKMADFWRTNVVGLIPPPLSTLADVNEMYRRDAGSTAIARGPTIDHVQALADLKRQAKEIEERAADLERMIKEEMKDASALVDAGGRRLATWKTFEREVFDQRTFTEQNPELAAQYRKTVETRRFALTI
jgi:putative phage-type endonuclease